MSNTAAHLVDAVLPHVPYRQWVLSFPRRVRFLLAKDSTLLSAVLDKALRKIFAWQRRRARSLGQAEPVAPMTGAVTFVQRFGSILNLNVHAHSLVPDGVFLQHNDGSIFFRPVPPPYKEDMNRLVLQIARATEKLIKQRERDAEMDEEGPDLLTPGASPKPQIPCNSCKQRCLQIRTLCLFARLLIACRTSDRFR